MTSFESSGKLLFTRLSNLTVLDLSKNYISNINDIGKCIGLTYLNISYNSIEDITELQHLQKLITLKASSNKITNIEPLKSCEKLQKLIICNNLLSSFDSTLTTLIKLQRLKSLTIYSNPFIYKTKDCIRRLCAGLNLIKFDKELINKHKDSANLHQSNLEKSRIIPKSPQKVDDAISLKSQIFKLKKDIPDLKNKFPIQIISLKVLAH